LEAFTAFGFLCINVNQENVQTLSFLKQLYVINLNVIGKVTRNTIIKFMPSIIFSFNFYIKLLETWVLNNKYISIQERFSIFNEDEEGKNLKELEPSLERNSIKNERSDFIEDHFNMETYYTLQNIKITSQNLLEFERNKFMYLIKSLDSCCEFDWTLNQE
jgi:hypothetical protein